MLKKQLSFWGKLSLSCFFVSASIAQQESSYTLDKIIEKNTAKYNQQGFSQEKIAKKNGKFEQYWSSRLTEDGTLGEMLSAFSDKPKSYGGFCGEGLGEWELVGPTHYVGAPLSDWQSGISHKQWNGLMTEVYSAPDQSFLLAASDRGGIWRRVPGETGWTNMSDNFNIPYLHITAIVASPYDQNIIFAASSGDYGANGIIKSTDAGITWSELTTFQDDYCAAFPSHCAGGNESFINTDDLHIDIINSSGPSNIHMYAITGNAIIWKSTDSGLNWVRLDDPGLPFPAPTLPTHYVWTDIEVDEDGNLYCVSNQHYVHNVDYWKLEPGIGWSDLTANISTSDPTSTLRFSTPVGNTIYALRDNTNRSILKSTDEGVTWSVIGTVPGGGGYGGVQAKSEFQYHPEVDRLYIGGNRLWAVEASTGTVFDIPQGHVDVRDVFFVGTPGNYWLYTANDGGVSKINLNDNSFTDISGDFLPVLQFSDIGTANSSDERYIGGVGHNHAKAFANGTWSQFTSGDGDAAVIHPSNPDLGYIVSSNSRVYRYNMTTGTTNSLGVSSSLVGGGWFNAHIDVHPAAPDNIYYTNDKGNDGINRIGIYDETVGTWSYEKLLPEMIRPGEIAMGVNNPEYIYVAEFSASHDFTHTQNLIRSNNWGVTGSWTSIGDGDVFDASGTTVIAQLNEVLAWKRITDIEVNPTDHNNLWITISGFVNEDEKNRVLVSYDGGESWREFSKGLPRYPAHSIIYIPATNGLMFTGTEAGIYYRDNSMSQWECFNNGMPTTVVTDLDYNTCSGKLIASTYGRGIWKSDIPTSESSLTYTSNTTIPLGNHKFNTDIVIKAPTVFTVLGTMQMAAGRKITVEPGATIVVDGGKITNQCDYLWGGLFLGGNSGEPQLSDAFITDPNQATLFVKNAGTIEHNEAVVTQAYHAGFNHGARIFSTNASFIDNKNDVILLSYSNDNVSYFRNTNFLTTGPLGDPGGEDIYGREMGTRTHISMWEITGVEFTKNRFINSGTFDKDIRGTGILSLDSDCQVTGICNSINLDGTCADMGIAFENLTTGIDFRSTTNSHQLIVRRNYFESTIHGITCTGGRELNLVDNMFYNYNGSDNVEPITTMKAWGIYLSGTNGALIRDNDFKDSDSNLPSDLNYYSRGIIVQNTGNTSTSIIKNKFEEGEMIAIQAWFNNTGVQTNCNKFYSEYGIYVDRPDIGVSIFPTQGTSALPVENKFFYSCSDQQRHIYFDGIDPISPWETVLDYHTIYTPTCISNDWSTLSYSDFSNPAPGYVQSFLESPSEESQCRSAHVAKRSPLVTPSEEERIENLMVELTELENFAGSKEELTAKLEEEEWLKANENGQLKPGNKYLELTNFRRVLYSNARILSHEIPTYSAEHLLEIKDLIEQSDEWVKLTYINACINANQINGIDFDGIDTDYIKFYNVMLHLKASNRSIYEMTTTELDILHTLASMPSLAGTKARAIITFIEETPFILEVDYLSPHNGENLNQQNVMDKQYKLNIYPNPASDAVTIEVPAGITANGIQILNITGSVVFKSNTLKTKYSINVKNWERGVYFILLHTEKGDIYEKLVIN